MVDGSKMLDIRQGVTQRFRWTSRLATCMTRKPGSIRSVWRIASSLTAEFAHLQIGWCNRYPIVSIEDPMADTDWDGWSTVASALRDRIQLVGDDLFTTNFERIQEGDTAKRRQCRSHQTQPNRHGYRNVSHNELTQQAGWNPVISARSGETEDGFISHPAVATNAGQLKVGSIVRGERVAKWNEVLRIERNLGSRARFIGRSILDQLKCQSNAGS